MTRACVLTHVRLLVAAVVVVVLAAERLAAEEVGRDHGEDVQENGHEREYPEGGRDRERERVHHAAKLRREADEADEAERTEDVRDRELHFVGRVV